MSKLPSLQFYPGDWLRDNISGCSLAAQGLWLRMLILMHDSERYGYLSLNGSPIPPGFVSRKCGCDTLEQYEALLHELDEAGIPSRTPEGVIYSRRMVRDARERERKNRNKADERKRAKTQDVTGDVTGDVTDMSPDSSSSSSSSSSEKKKDGRGAVQPKVEPPRQPAVPEEDIFIRIPVNGDMDHVVTLKDVDGYKALYGNVDVEAHLRKMRGHWDSKPKNQRKTLKGIKTSINTWLAKEQDRGGGMSRPAPKVEPEDRNARRRKLWEEIPDEWKAQAAPKWLDVLTATERRAYGLMEATA